MTALPAHVAAALEEAVAELPHDIHPDDVLDTMCQLVRWEDVDRHDTAIRARLEMIR